MTTGEELRRLLGERAMTQRELARLSHYDPGFVNKLCCDKRPLTVEVAAVLEDVLNAGGALVSLVNRRQVIAGAAAIAGAPLLGALNADERERLEWARRHPPRVDVSVVQSLADVLGAQRRAEDFIGPRAVMRPVLAQLAEIEEFVRHARGPMRPALIEVAQQWAQYSAYLHRDAGNPSGDRALLAQALEWAEEIGDRTMMATVLVQRGNMALAAGELGTAIGLAQAAQRDQTVDAGQRADGADLEARGHAMAGDAAAAERKLDDAAGLAAQLVKMAQNRRPWLYWMSLQYFECARGATLCLLADDPRYAGRAAATLEAGYARLPDDQRSSAWAARYLAHLASVHVRAGNAEQAYAVAIQCAEITRVTGSARLRGMLVELHSAMAERWPGDSRVAELSDALR